MAALSCWRTPNLCSSSPASECWFMDQPLDGLAVSATCALGVAPCKYSLGQWWRLPDEGPEKAGRQGGEEGLEGRGVRRGWVAQATGSGAAADSAGSAVAAAGSRAAG